MTDQDIVSPANDRHASCLSHTGRGAFFADEAAQHPSTSPRLYTLPALPLYQAVLKATEPEPAAYVTLDDLGFGGLDTIVVSARWKIAWGAGQYRRRTASPARISPRALYELADPVLGGESPTCRRRQQAGSLALSPRVAKVSRFSRR